jgi:acylphosphatase
MVDMQFFISGQKIFHTGFRPGLVELADDVGVKVHATNLKREDKIRVIVSGTQENVTMYHDSVKKHEVPVIFPEKKPTYKPTAMVEYSGPDIDWNGHNLQFMSAQLSRTMNYSNIVFHGFDEKLNNIHSDVNRRNHRVKSAEKRL